MASEVTVRKSAELSPVKRALLEMRELRARLRALEHQHREPIAIIGVGCRFPGASNGPSAFWRMLRDGIDAIREVPPERWNHARYYDEDPLAPGMIATRWGGFIDDIDAFDPSMFSLSPREAMAMDPQHRLLLEVGWEALEHAGHAPDRLAGSSTGVFVGISSLDYAHLALSAPDEALDAHLAQGIAHSAASGRLAYALGLQGPAISVDTACSSSLLAVHLAVQSLRRGECRMALAGGVNAILTPHMLIGFSRSRMMAADGRCKTFDARADGFVRGEGCGVIVLKRLSDAIADRDTIWAIVRGSAANQDGRSSGFTAPNRLAQESVIRAALADASVAPHEVSYIEAHGTGTALGDPIEVQALGAVLGEGRNGTPVVLGSLKTNVGHMEAAAGVAGVIKVTLALAHGEIPRTLHLETPNPFIPWAELPVTVAGERMGWAPVNGRRVAGVSSFGFTGTNVHVVLEDATARDEPARSLGQGGDSVPAAMRAGSSPDRTMHLLKLAARDRSSLHALTTRWAEELAQESAPFASICYTANVGRADLPERAVVLASSAMDARSRLLGVPDDEATPWVLRGRAPDTPGEIAFLFTGHGAQYPGMARVLFDTQPTFRAALEECDALLRCHLDRPLIEVIHEGGASGTSPMRTGMTYSQPALFAVEYALARLWQSWGIEPTAVLGHSLGEYVGAVIAGVFSLSDGLDLVAARGRLMDSLPGTGGMLALSASEMTVRTLLHRYPELALAAINGPGEIVLSGPLAAIVRLEEELSASGIEFRRLKVAQAAHSPLLDPILDAFEAIASRITFSPPRLTLISCTTGAPVSAAEIGSASYWRRHLRDTVRFADAMRALYAEGYRTFVEVGPHPQLSGSARETLATDDCVWVATLRRDADDWQQILESVGTLYVAGHRIDWEAFERPHLDSGDCPRRRVPLPTYVWNHARYWLPHVPLPYSRTDAREAVPDWTTIVTNGRQMEEQGPLDLAVQSFPARWHLLDRLTTAVVATTLRELGAFPQAGRQLTVEDLHARCGVLPRYSRLVSRWLSRLASAGLLDRTDATYRVTDRLTHVAVDAAWREAEAALADWEFMLDYLRRCAALLPRVITGAESPLETMFPGGSFDSADQLYRDSVLPRYFNRLATGIVEPLVRSPRAVPLRVLEVGAGTGGLTASLLPPVAAAGGSYHFTDVTELFLTRAAERFAAHERVTFGLLDVDADPMTQGYVPHSFDVIAASNVLHASRSIPETLGRLRSLLAPGGLLVLIEVTSYLSWFELSTALLEGWDRQDDDLRQEHPMLSAEEWLCALRGAGFVEAAAFPRSGSAAEVLAQHVVVAQAPLDVKTDAATTSLPADARMTQSPVAMPVERSHVEQLVRRIREATSQEREELLMEFVRRQIAVLLRMEDAERVPRRARLMDLGLDSLMAVELRSRLSKGLDLPEPLPATLIFDHPTVEAIVDLLLRRFDAGGARSHERGTTAAMDGLPPIPAQLAALADDEVEARLLATLKLIEGQT